MSLKTYHKKRNFKKTPEPKGRVHKTHHDFFCVQKHAASHLHYDFRLELDGVLKSWAVPKGPCLDPTVKRLGIQVEDHPLGYGTFQGIIPKGEYGGGTVMLWDQGTWHCLDENPTQACEKGHLRFELQGKKLKGRWDLIRFKPETQWFLIKYRDEYAKSLKQYDITLEEPLSVSTQQTMDDIAQSSSTKKKPIKPSKTVDFALTTEQKALISQLPKSPFPERIDVQLATLVDKPPHGEQWVHEVKFDGYRIIALKNGKKISLISRNHQHWTDKFPNVVESLKQLPVKQAVFDGELVVLDYNNRTNFQWLQHALKHSVKTDFVYYLFDVLYWQGADIRALPLLQRKRFLRSIISDNLVTLRYSDHIVDQGERVFKQACDFALEGIVSKRSESNYVGARTQDWLKVKCTQRQEFVVGGFSNPQGTRSCFGSLFLGVYDGAGEFVFVGNVGTGFNQHTLNTVFQALKELITQKNPFNSKPPRVKSATWVKPQLVIEVEFSEWTQDGRLRHPSFKGIRMDKKPKEVIHEKVQSVDQIKHKSPKTRHLLPSPTCGRGAGVVTKTPKKGALTNPQKVLYPEDGITKQDLYDYYQAIGPTILPYIKNRLLTLVRCPSSYNDCFYQKHALPSKTSAIHSVAIPSSKGTKYSITIKDLRGLLQLVQMGVLEIHPWGSTINHLYHPDIIIFDLDPSPEVSWRGVVEAAFDIKTQLEAFHLTTFVKTTGGKGLHIVIPVKPEYDWELVKEFTHTFSSYLEQQNPSTYISKMSKRDRKGKIFVDYLRNQWEATVIAPYSTRARIHAPIATPIHWHELTDKQEDTYFTIKTLPHRLHHQKDDPWKAFWSTKQSLRLDKL